MSPLLAADRPRVPAAAAPVEQPDAAGLAEAIRRAGPAALRAHVPGAAAFDLFSR